MYDLEGIKKHTEKLEAIAQNMKEDTQYQEERLIEMRRGFEQENYAIARKESRQSMHLSVAAFVISIIALILRIVAAVQ